MVPTDLEEARTYRVAVWDTASRICAISSEFGVSGELVRLCVYVCVCCFVVGNGWKFAVVLWHAAGVGSTAGRV